MLQNEIQTKLQQKKLKKNETKHLNFKKICDCFAALTCDSINDDGEYVA